MRKARGAPRLLVIVSIVATGLGLAAPPAAAAPGITVTPTTGLLDGQAVTVAGTGFTPDVTVEVIQCAGAWPGRCQGEPVLNGTAARVSVGADGAFTVRLRVRRTLDPRTGADQGCAASECSVVAAELTSGPNPAEPPTGTERARVGIDLEATGSVPPPGPATLAITPTEPVRADRAVTRWTGAGYDRGFLVTPLAATDGQPLILPQGSGGGSPQPGAAVLVCRPTGPQGAEQCLRWRTPVIPVGSSGWAFSNFYNQPVRADGTVDAPLTVPRVLMAAGERIDCAVERCRFALAQDEAPRSPGVEVAWAREWAPWPSATELVTDAYRAIMGRRPTAPERSTAVAGLRDRSLTARAFLRDLAADNGGRRLAELIRLYRAALYRAPDRAGLLYWERELQRHGGNMNAIASAFGRSPEFRRLFGPQHSDAVAVDSAYVFTLSRSPTPAERAYWVGQLRAGLSRPHMVHLFSRTPEFLRISAGSSEVSVVIITLLARDVTLDEFYRMGDGYSCRTPQGWWQGAEACVDDVLLGVLGSDELATQVG